MQLKIYGDGNFSTTHERNFFDDLVKILKNADLGTTEPIYLLYNFRCLANQIDAVLLKRDAIIILEFKNYGGEITYNENGNWKAGDTVIKGGAEDRNPEQQVRAYKQSLINFFNEHSNELLVPQREIAWGHISGIVLFYNNITFNKEKLPQRIKPWFFVTDISGIVQKLKNITSSGLQLTNKELEKIPKLLNLKEFDTQVFSASLSHSHPPIAPDNIPTKANNVKLPNRQFFRTGNANADLIEYFKCCIQEEDFKKIELVANNIRCFPPSEPNLLNDNSTLTVTSNDPFFQIIQGHVKNGNQKMFYGFPIIKIFNKFLPLLTRKTLFQNNGNVVVLKSDGGEDIIVNEALLNKLNYSIDEIEAIKNDLEPLDTAQKISYIQTEIQTKLQQPPSQQGIAFFAEPTIFNRSLLYELDEIKRLVTNNVDSSSIQFLLQGNELPPPQNNKHDLIFDTELFEINTAQKNAIESLFNKRLTLVTGPPGTGKSQIILNIFGQAIKNGKSVLFASKNNKAVDVVIERFKEVIQYDLIVRVGNRDENDKAQLQLQTLAKTNFVDDNKNIQQNDNKAQNRQAINNLWLRKFTKDGAKNLLGNYGISGFNKNKTSWVNEFKKLLDILPIWCVTNLSIKQSIPFEPEIFDLLIIDEASQCDIPSAIPLFYRCKNTIVIGDPCQLKHISSLKMKEDDAIATGLAIANSDVSYSTHSLYDKIHLLFKKYKKSPIMLTEHFRCHEHIITYSNENFYLPKTGRELDIKTPQHILNNRLPVSWYNVKGINEKNKRNNNNEVSCVIDILTAIYNFSQNVHLEIGIITPFRDQVDELKNKAGNNFNNVIIDSVHKFQGDEKDIIIFSPVISTGAQPSMKSFINTLSPQLLNVAVTRARQQLIIVGDYDECKKSGGYLGLLAIHAKTYGCIWNESTLLSELQQLNQKLQSIKETYDRFFKIN